MMAGMQVVQHVVEVLLSVHLLWPVPAVELFCLGIFLHRQTLCCVGLTLMFLSEFELMMRKQ